MCVNIHLDVWVRACRSCVQTRVCLIGEQLAWQATSDEGIMGWRLCLALSFMEMIAREHLVSNQHPVQHQFPKLPTAAAINDRTRICQSVHLWKSPVCHLNAARKTDRSYKSPAHINTRKDIFTVILSWLRNVVKDPRFNIKMYK